MEVYDFGLDFGTFFQVLMGVIVAPIALALGYELGTVVVINGLRWIRGMF